MEKRDNRNPSRDMDAPIWLAHGADVYDLIKPVTMRKNISVGTVLIAQGASIAHIYFVLKGRAQAFIYTEDGQRFWVADFGPGDIFGHPEILSDTPIEFEVRADTDMKLAVLPANTFMDMMNKAKGFGKNISLHLATSLSRANTRLFELATLPAAARIHAELLRMAEPIGKAPETMIIRPHPVYSNFALRVHSTRETVSRVVNRLQKLGIVTRETGALVILKPGKLQRNSS